jgi:L-threonylcarbamoyladenylate synthase
VLDDHAVILRPGIITKDQIEKVLNRPCIFAKKGEKLQAPGMKYRHYAPKAKIVITSKITPLDLVKEKTLFMAKESQDHPLFEKLSEDNLYAAFRKADRLGCAVILIEDNGLIEEGLLNRIEKAKD